MDISITAFNKLIRLSVKVSRTSTTSCSDDLLLLGSALFWDITRRRVLIAYRRFETTYWSHLQRSRIIWRWDRYVVPKRRWTITTRRRVISQKSAHLINIAAKAWNLNCSFLFKGSLLRTLLVTTVIVNSHGLQILVTAPIIVLKPVEWAQDSAGLDSTAISQLIASAVYDTNPTMCKN